MKIWIDADAAPRDVKELVFRSAKRLAIEVVLVANQCLQTPTGNAFVSAVWVDGVPDVADQYIAVHAAAGDLVVTQDVPLAALLVPKGVAVLDHRGEEHTDETIGERLSVRDFMDQEVMRNRIGAERGWPPTSRAEYEREIAAGSLYVGSPETVARKIAATLRALGASRFDLKYSAGTLRHQLMLRSIELYGREVIPRVRQMLAEAPAMTAEGGLAASGI